MTDLKLVGFIPSGIRLEIAQEIIERMGIRPLAREIGVNPKSVYKYKHGSAHPGDEVMERILAVAKREDPDLVEKYMDKLREDFSSALGTSIEPKEILKTVEKESAKGRPEVAHVSREGGVVQKPTDRTSGGSGVAQESTEEVTFDEICERMGVSIPFNRMKVKKILNALLEDPELSLGELVERTALSEGALDKYLEKMISEETVERVDSDVYRLLVEVGD